MPNGTQKRWLLLLLAPILAFIIRVAYDIATPQTLTFDEPFYEDLVTNMITGKGYTFSSDAYHTAVADQPTSFQEPTYPLFLSAIYSIVGLHNYLPVRIVQAVMGALTVLFISLTATEIANERAGFFAGLIAAFYPALLYFNRLLMTENLFIFLFIVAIWMWILGTKSDNLWWWIGSGILFGLCCLTRGMLLWFMPPLFILTFLIIRHKRYLKLGLLIVTFVACLLPWTIRNYMVQHAFVPLTTKGGWNLYFYTYPSDNTDWNGERYNIVPLPNVTNLTEVERDHLYQSLGIQNIKEHPDIVVRYAILKFIDFWDARLQQGSLALTLINAVAFYGVVLCALIASFRVIRYKISNSAYYILWLVIFFHTGTAMLFTGGGKARMPIEPALLVLSGCGMAIILNWIPVKAGAESWLVKWFRLFEI